jgi:primosomal protein N' (replication factor Y) (superfamily II helicase)
MNLVFLKIAVAFPLDVLDYFPPPNVEIAPEHIGCRVRVPFGNKETEQESLISKKKREIIGLLMGISNTPNVAIEKIKPALELIDKEPLVSQKDLELIQWTAKYYHCKIGWTMQTALPNILFQRTTLSDYKIPEPSSIQESALNLNEAQQQAVEIIERSFGQFKPFLLEGMTGSGKTEVYLQLIDKIIKNGKQALVLVPEINLTPQTVERFQKRFEVPISTIHSNIDKIKRLNNWQMAKDGIAKIVIGTRSAVWTPIMNLGLIIIDEEHDTSYKQQDGLLYSARDVAIRRAQLHDIPIILGTATPSFESIYNVQLHKYQLVILPKRAGVAKPPSYRVIDMRQYQGFEQLSPPLRQAIAQRLERDEQTLIYLNRRGFSPSFMCYACGWVAMCFRCSSRLTYHAESHILHCHHCDAKQQLPQMCPNCQSVQVKPVGFGTERIEQALETHFPHARILRIDSDSTRRKTAMKAFLAQIHKGDADILVGTQMLAKGHHFPKVTLVGIINADSGLLSADFRATERLAQGLIQVAGRAGREAAAGDVILQTHHPEHPLLVTLLKKGYRKFSDLALQERKEVGLPPYQFMGLLRAQCKTQSKLQDFLRQARALAEQFADLPVQIFGPINAPLAKRAHFFRGQLVLQASERRILHALLDRWLVQLPTKIHWILDVDPMDFN